MNERIEELSLQCIRYKLIAEGARSDFDYKKFAELIVKDCMTMCSELQADYLKHRKASDDFTDKNIYAEGEAACDILRHKMKKQFGVEK